MNNPVFQTPDVSPREARLLIVIVLCYFLFGFCSSLPAILFSTAENLASPFTPKNMLIMALSASAFVFFPFFNVKKFQKISWLVAAGAVVAFVQILPPILGQTLNGASRWFLGFQVSDLISLYLVFYTASICSERNYKIKRECRTFIGVLKYVVLPLGVFACLVGILQKNFSTAALQMLSALVILWIGGIVKLTDKLFISLFVAAAIGAALMIHYQPYRGARVRNWINYDLDLAMSPLEAKPKTENKDKPANASDSVATTGNAGISEENTSENNANENYSGDNLPATDSEGRNTHDIEADPPYMPDQKDMENNAEEQQARRTGPLPYRQWDNTFRDYAMGAGSQAFYSKIAIISGGISGLGPAGSGINANNKLAVSESDFLFSVLCSEYGFFLITIVMIVTAYFLHKAFALRDKNSGRPDDYLNMLSIGVAVMLSLQAIFHIWVNLGLFPVTGIPLPLFSNGGSSRVITLAMLGILLNAACDRYSTPPDWFLNNRKKIFAGICVLLVSVSAGMLVFLLYSFKNLS